MEKIANIQSRLERLEKIRFNHVNKKVFLSQYFLDINDLRNDLLKIDYPFSMFMRVSKLYDLN